MTGEELVDFINNDLFKTLKNLSFGPDVDPRGFIVREVFEDAYNYMKSGTLIRQVVNKINAIDFNVASERHLFGDIYEQILKDLQSAGNAGEYYTPRAVTQFMTNMVNPRLGEKVLDPACGTGGFLVCALENIRNNEVKTVEDNASVQDRIDKFNLPYFHNVAKLGLASTATLAQQNFIVSVEEKEVVPNSISVNNFPNPFNNSTIIRYVIPEEGNISLDLYNSLGEKIENLSDGFKIAGEYEVYLNGISLASGVYFIILRTSEHFVSHKILMLK